MPLSPETAEFLDLFGFAFPLSEYSGTAREAELSHVFFRTLKEGETILKEGDSCTAMPFVLAGGIRVFRASESGREITLYRIGPGQTCIFSSVCGTKDISFPARAASDSPTRAAFLPVARVRGLFAKSEAFRDFVISQFSARMDMVMELVEEIAFRRVDERLAARLGKYAQDGYVKETHQELADHLGTSREVVSRILKEWEDRGAVALSRGQIRILATFEKTMKY